MTSQPTTGRSGVSENGERRPRGQMPEAGPRRTSGPPAPVVLPLILLIILGMAGLRGAVAAPRWNGPLEHDGLAIGLALGVILGVLLVITIRRRSAAAWAKPVPGAPASHVAARLRAALIFVLGAGMIAVAVALLAGLHLKVSAQPPAPSPPRSVPHKDNLAPVLPAAGFHLPLSTIAYGLLIVVLVAAAASSGWWSRQLRPSRRHRRRGYLAQDPEDPEDLREAVESGRWALRALDDARAAIIACYVAMENSLAERGEARAIADTPDELLARATQSGLVRGTAAARLTALFYEARFSSHPMDRGQRDAAEQALDELAAAVAEPAGKRAAR
jgi:hypothetical protein